MDQFLEADEYFIKARSILANVRDHALKIHQAGKQLNGLRVCRLFKIAHLLGRALTGGAYHLERPD